jgi:hypothetical protein
VFIQGIAGAKFLEEDWAETGTTTTVAIAMKVNTPQVTPLTLIASFQVLNDFPQHGGGCHVRHQPNRFCCH